MLRHRDLSTTAIYAKVDREPLRELAQPLAGERGMSNLQVAAEDLGRSQELP